MIATVTNSDRIAKTREKLHQLKERGFKYIVTDEAGEVWLGSTKAGLEIEEAISSPFMGEIMLDEK